MRWMWLTLWCGCGTLSAPSGGGAPPGSDSGAASDGSDAADGTDGSGDGTDGTSDGSDGTSDGTDGSGDGTGGTGPDFGCPAGMAAVPTDAPVYCIDAYEASEGADGTLASVPGADPKILLTFLEARAGCEATPTYDASGNAVGFKRLATVDEWRDAADGVVGAGGSTYPTGEEWPAGVCVIQEADGTQVFDEAQPTGSHPDCVSAFGVFDQLGNAWEWADPELDIDIQGFLDASSGEGIALILDEADQIRVESGGVSAFRLDVPGLQGDVRVQDGVMVADVTFDADEPFDYEGFLMFDQGAAVVPPGTLLPIEVLREGGVETDAAAPVVVRPTEDGQPITGKVGCAFYSGQPGGCGNADVFLGHPYDFAGTISPRCAADPL